MDRDRDLEQHKVVDLDRGLFFVQYKTADDAASPPRVVVSAAPGHERKVEFLLHPDADDPVLWQPNTTLIVRTTAPATLQVQVLPLRPNGSRAAAVRIEPLGQGKPPAAPQRLDQGFPPDAVNYSGLRILGHVAGIGDVVVGPNAWIAGPETPSRIEGIAVEWPDRPDDLDLRYAVKFATAQPASGKMVSLGTYAGTRGRALPITGLVLEASGAGASDFQFVAEAMFLSSPTLRAIGKRVVLSGPTGREPLVGLRVNFEGIKVPAAITRDLTAPPPPAEKPRAGRVRVFRKRSKQGAAAE